jgi:CheY-like chemotaxis protein
MMEQKLLKCCRTPYKLIFVDLNMPVMDGYTMMGAMMNGRICKSTNSESDLQNAYSKSVFVLNTAGIDNNIGINYKSRGFQYFLEKPLQ